MDQLKIGDFVKFKTSIGLNVVVDFDKEGFVLVSPVEECTVQAKPDRLVKIDIESEQSNKGGE